MTLLAWVELISAALKFPDAIMRIVNALKKTPSEKQAELAAKIEAEADALAKTGRPTWDA